MSGWQSKPEGTIQGQGNYLRDLGVKIPRFSSYPHNGVWMCADELRRTSGFNLQGYWKYRLSIWFMRAASLQGRHSQQAAHTRRHLAALQRSGTRSPPGARGPARPPPKSAMVRPGAGRAGGQRAVRFRVGVRAGALWLLLPAGSQARRGRALCAGSALASRWRRWRINRSTSTGG